MRRVRTGRLSILWGVQPPWSEILLAVRQQASGGRSDRALSITDDITCAAGVIIRVLRRTAPAHGDVLRSGWLDGALGPYGPRGLPCGDRRLPSDPCNNG